MGDDQLEDYFNFSAADLEANRLGRMTPAQQARFVTGENTTHMVSRVIAVIALLLTLIPLFYIVNDIMTGAVGEIKMGFFPWIVIGALVSFFSIRRSMEKVFDLTVHKIEGPINLHVEKNYIDPNSEELDYALQIQGEAFDVDAELADIMDKNDIYAIYYLNDPHTHAPVEILSAELLSKRPDR